jgi:hypothetical protein
LHPVVLAHARGLLASNEEDLIDYLDAFLSTQAADRHHHRTGRRLHGPHARVDRVIHDPIYRD